MATFGIPGALCLLLVVQWTHALTYTIKAQNEPINIISDYFISTTVDTSNISAADFSNPLFIKAIKHMSPMYLRIGGTQADAFLFDASSELDYAQGVLSGKYWLKIAEFAEATNVRLLFDLNSLHREEDNSWKSDNAESMLKFSHENGLDLDWELGNEPDLYNALFQTYVDSLQLGKDYVKLRSLLDQYGYNGSSLVGPSLFDPAANSDTKDYLKNFLSVANSAIRAVTFHQYYFDGQTAKVEQYTDPSYYAHLEKQLDIVKSIVGSDNKLWLAETSSSNRGGTRHVADRFIGGFLWLDKLGLGAQMGLELIVRQSSWGLGYSLLDPDYNPNPDWWLSILYKNLVGRNVLAVSNDGEDLRLVRLYAHCAEKNALWGDSGAVVVYGFNVGNDSSTVQVDLAGLTETTQVYSFELTAESDLLSQNSLLNGEVLKLTKDSELPEFSPKVSKPSDTYTLKPYSLVFWVFSNTEIKACQ